MSEKTFRRYRISPDKVVVTTYRVGNSPKGNRLHDRRTFRVNDILGQSQFIGDALQGCECSPCELHDHASDCAVHNGPAMPIGSCDCR